jgi:hypothetical protein
VTRGRPRARWGSTSNVLLGGEDATHTGNTNIGGGGIALEANRAGILNIDVLNNTVAANVPEPGAVNAALYVQSANSGAGGSTITPHVLGNSFTADVNDDPIADVVFDNLTSTIRLQGWNGAPANDPTAFITGQNTFPADSVTDVLPSGAVVGFAGDAVPAGGPVPGQQPRSRERPTPAPGVGGRPGHGVRGPSPAGGPAGRRRLPRRPARAAVVPATPDGGRAAAGGGGPLGSMSYNASAC